MKDRLKHLAYSDRCPEWLARALLWIVSSDRG